MMIVFEDVPGGILRAKARRHDRSSDKRNTNLTAVCVRGKQQWHALRQSRKDVGIVCERDQRLSFGNTGECVSNPLRLCP